MGGICSPFRFLGKFNLQTLVTSELVFLPLLSVFNYLGAW